MTQTPNSPFMRVARSGSLNTDLVVDVDAFGRSLAQALVKEKLSCRHVPIETDALPKWRSTIEITDNGDGNPIVEGLILVITTDHPSKRHNGRVAISVNVPGIGVRGRVADVCLSAWTASFATQRPLNILAREVIRKIIVPAIPDAIKVRTEAQATQERRVLLNEKVAELQARFPGLLRMTKTDDGLNAQVDGDSASGAKDFFYLRGRIDHHGSFTLDRVQTLSPEFFVDFCALIRRHYPGEGEAKRQPGVADLVDSLSPYVSGDDVGVDRKTFLTYVSDRIRGDLGDL